MQNAYIDLKRLKCKRLELLLIPFPNNYYTYPQRRRLSTDALNILHIIHFIMMDLKRHTNCSRNVHSRLCISLLT